MNKKQILTNFLQNKKIADDWLARVPREINDAFFDNPQTNAMEQNEEMLLKEVFGEDNAYFILTFCLHNFIDRINSIDTIEDFVEFICKEESNHPQKIWEVSDEDWQEILKKRNSWLLNKEPDKQKLTYSKKEFISLLEKG